MVKQGCYILFFVLCCCYELNAQDTINYDSIAVGEDSIVFYASPDYRQDAGAYQLPTKGAYYIPSATPTIVDLLPVTTTNNLSSNYSVRGGSFDENLVYIHGLEMYRSALSRSGQQDGLGAVNPSMIKNATFYGGSWSATLGDKLSSALTLDYLQPSRFTGMAEIGILGGNLVAGTASKNQRVKTVIGGRLYLPRYLYKAFDVDGDYFSSFQDVQAFTTFDISKKNSQRLNTIEWYSSIANNNYTLLPQKRQSNFGTLFNALQIDIEFEGKEEMGFMVGQHSLQWNRDLSRKKKQQLIQSVNINYLVANEFEYQNIKGVYRLCQLNGTDDNTDCNSLGEGVFFDYSRNQLHFERYEAKWRLTKKKLNFHTWELGFDIRSYKWSEQIKEYHYTDSVGYRDNESFLFAQNSQQHQQLKAFAWKNYKINPNWQMNYGIRFLYLTIGNQLLVAPRLGVSKKAKGKHNIVYKWSAGVYQQPPLYREMRKADGRINTTIRAPQSVQSSMAMDYKFLAFDKSPMTFYSEVYGKYLWDVIPYYMDNVSIRYYGQNLAEAYVIGWDGRLSGEFVKGLESVFNFSLLSTKERWYGDTEYIRRPMDQRLTTSITFKDRLPNYPSIAGSLKFVYGTGLPFGPPQDIENRAAFTAPSFRRIDIGFSKAVSYQEGKLKSLWVGLDILNVLDINNTVSYLWISDINQNQLAVPETLPGRFLNLRLIAKW